jgi:hypothetical protein
MLISMSDIGREAALRTLWTRSDFMVSLGMKKRAEPGLRPRLYPKAAICSSAALRSMDWPGISTGRSKGFQASPTTCS